MNSRNLKDLFEAYSEIYDNEYLTEMGRTRTTGQDSGTIFKPNDYRSAGSAGGSGSGGRRGTRPSFKPAVSPKPAVPRRLPSEVTGVVDPKWDKPTPKSIAPASRPTPRATGPVSRPTPTTAPKSSPAITAKVSPTPQGGQTGDKVKDTQTWAKANPTLANKPQRTFNPLMQKTFGYQTGYSPSEVKGNIQKTKTLAGAGLMNSDYSWGSASQLVDDIANAYQSVYEAKKVDQDKDGDNDFADVQIARMIASGVPKEVAIAKVKGKSYNEEVEIQEESEEEKKRNERRARIAELQAQGRVMTSSKRTSQRAKERREEQKAEKLEKLANAALEATRGATRRSSKPMGTEKPEPKAEAPKANRRLSSTVRNDRLASRADELLRMLQNEDFILWIDELLDEGYELDNWTDEELYDLYEEIIEEKYGTAAGRSRVAKMARAGKDIGKKGPGFKSMVDKLTPKYGKERATKIAAAQMYKTHA
jgi:hypothetical protein